MKGRKVKQPANRNLSTGNHSVVSAGVIEHGETISSGIYDYKLIKRHYKSN